MSTLKTHNLQSPDAGSVNIALTPNAGMVVAGVSTYSNQINVGSNIKLGTAGVVTATSFVGSGANLTSLPAQATIANNADNRVITGGSGVNLNGEANLIFDGSSLGINVTSPSYPLDVVGDGGGSFSASSNSTNGVLSVVGKNSSGSVSAISRIKSYPDGSSNQSHMAFETRNSSSQMVERLRIDSNGNMGLGTLLASDAGSAGAGLKIEKYVQRNNIYSFPDGYYGASLGEVQNTENKVWASIDSHYNRTSAVSAGIFLSAFHADAGGSGCGAAIKNLKAGNALTFSTVTTGASVGSVAVETERLRITSDGRLSINDSTPNSNETLTIQPVGNIACDVALKMNNSTDSRIKFYDDNGTWRGGFGFTNYANNTDYPNFHDSFYMQTDPSSNGTLAVAMRLNREGCFMYPKQPCFSVVMSSDYSSSTSHTANFNTERFDQGNNFNTGSNGIFTAPVTGKYYMHAAIQTRAGGTASQAHIMGVSFLVNGSVQVSKGSGDQYLGRDTAHYITVHCIRILNLAQGDTVQVYIQLHATVEIEGSGGSDRCNWQGYLMA